jgi:hypothetical protein
MLQCVHVLTWRQGMEEAELLSQLDILCMCACVLLFGSAHFHSVHIFTFDMLLRQFYPSCTTMPPFALFFAHLAYIPGCSCVMA